MSRTALSSTGGGRDRGVVDARSRVLVRPVAGQRVAYAIALGSFGWTSLRIGTASQVHSPALRLLCALADVAIVVAAVRLWRAGVHATPDGLVSRSISATHRFGWDTIDRAEPGEPSWWADPRCPGGGITVHLVAGRRHKPLNSIVHLNSARGRRWADRACRRIDEEVAARREERAALAR